MKIQELKVKAIEAELGRRTNNKARKAKGEKPAMPAAWYFGALNKAEFATVLEGGEVERTFPSGDYKFVLSK